MQADEEPYLPYRKPPIVEAVIALHFAVPVNVKVIDAFARKQRALFVSQEDVFVMSASFDMKNQRSSTGSKKIGCRMYNCDRTHVLTVTESQVSVANLAPYTSWPALYEEARALWHEFSNISKNQIVNHVSTRYINRLDIPVDSEGKVDLHRYLIAGLSLPQYAQASALETFNISCSLLHGSREYRFILNLSSAPSFLIDKISFIIDIDCATVLKIPSDDEKMWKLISSLRQHKNELFESCITEETRTLFQ